jgi:hypothetical protein
MPSKKLEAESDEPLDRIEKGFARLKELADEAGIEREKIQRDLEATLRAIKGGSGGKRRRR